MVDLAIARLCILLRPGGWLRFEDRKKIVLKKEGKDWRIDVCLGYSSRQEGP